MTKPMVVVTWNDAQDHCEAWVDEIDAEGWAAHSCLIISIGFLVSRTERYVTLAADWDEDDKNYGRLTKIPASMLVSIDTLVATVI